MEPFALKVRAVDTGNLLLWEARATGIAPLFFSIFADRQLEDGKLREMADRVFYETADYDGDGKLDIMELYTAVLLFYK
jgi:hypothetical protein